MMEEVQVDIVDGIFLHCKLKPASFGADFGMNIKLVLIMALIDIYNNNNWIRICNLRGVTHKDEPTEN